MSNFQWVDSNRWLLNLFSKHSIIIVFQHHIPTSYTKSYNFPIPNSNIVPTCAAVGIYNPDLLFRLNSNGSFALLIPTGHKLRFYYAIFIFFFIPIAYLSDFFAHLPIGIYSIYNKNIYIQPIKKIHKTRII